DGQLAAAIRRPGSVILIDEPSVARPGALFVLQAVLDDDRAMHIPDTGEVIPVAPDVLFLLADNTNGTGDTSGQYEATRILNRATLDRLALTVRLDYMSPQQEAKALVNRTGIDGKRAAVLAKFAALTRSKADDGHLSHGVGLRRLVSLAKRLRAGIDANAAFQMAVLETAPEGKTMTDQTNLDAAGIYNFAGRLPYEQFVNATENTLRAVLRAGGGKVHNGTFHVSTGGGASASVHCDMQGHYF
ncbi:hypothetical protein ADUPG1_001340, partial [Aduncisulcus paluster]